MHTAVKAIECLAGEVVQSYWVTQAVKNVRRVTIQACGLELPYNEGVLMPAARLLSIRWRLIQAGHVSKALGVFTLSGLLCDSLLSMVDR